MAKTKTAPQCQGCKLVELPKNAAFCMECWKLVPKDYQRQIMAIFSPSLPHGPGWQTVAEAAKAVREIRARSVKASV